MTGTVSTQRFANKIKNDLLIDKPSIIIDAYMIKVFEMVSKEHYKHVSQSKAWQKLDRSFSDLQYRSSSELRAETKDPLGETFRNCEEDPPITDRRFQPAQVVAGS